MKLIRERSFYRTVLSLGLPIALQNLMTQLTAIVDTIMLGQADVNGSLISASSLANQPFFILSIACFGLASGAAVLTAQYWGNGNRDAIRTIISMILKVAVVISALMSAAVLLFPEQIMRLYSSDPVICAYGVEYLRIIGFAYIFFGFGNTLLCAVRSVELVRISIVVNAASFVTNVFLNWVLIFGHLGAPALGIRGAAIATLVARLVEFLVTVVYIMALDKRLSFRSRHLFLFRSVLARDLLRHGTPVLLNEVMWALTTSIQAAIVGHITYASGDPVAANTIASMVQQIAIAVILGLGNTAAVLVGKAIGEGRREEAHRRADTFCIVSVLVGIAVGLLILVLEKPILMLYGLEANTMHLASHLIRTVALITFFVSVSTTLIIGVLRGGGDTRFCLITEMICLWGLALPAAAFGAFVLQLPVPLVLFLMKSDEPAKAIICFIRLKRGKWMRSLTREREVLADGAGS